MQKWKCESKKISKILTRGVGVLFEFWQYSSSIKFEGIKQRDRALLNINIITVGKILTLWWVNEPYGRQGQWAVGPY